MGHNFGFEFPVPAHNKRTPRSASFFFFCRLVCELSTCYTFRFCQFPIMVNHNDLWQIHWQMTALRMPEAQLFINSNKELHLFFHSSALLLRYLNSYNMLLILLSLE